MSLDQYNKLMSNMLNQRQVLVKLRAELKGMEGKLCRRCGKFRHSAWNCRCGEEQKKKMVTSNKFKILEN